MPHLRPRPLALAPGVEAELDDAGFAHVGPGGKEVKSGGKGQTVGAGGQKKKQGVGMVALG